MWFKLAGATFTKNLGTMSSLSQSYSISYTLGTGLTKVSAPGSVANDNATTLTATFTLDTTNYELGTATVTMGGTTLTKDTDYTLTLSSTTLTLTIPNVSGSVSVTIGTNSIGGGSAGDGDSSSGDSGTYTVTINPTPSNATVIMALGMDSITTGTSKSNINSGNTVWYLIEKEGYVTESGIMTVSSNLTKNISLTSYGASGTKIPITWYPQEYYYSVSPVTSYNTVTSMDRVTTSNAPTINNHKNYWSTQIFTKDTLPNGSIITIATGYQYRPDGVPDLSSQRTISNRPANVTTASVTVDDAWWGNNEYVGFNISSTSSVSLTSKTEDDLNNIFSITLP